MAMKRSLPIAALPVEVRVEDAVEMACAEDVTFIEERLRRGMSVLVECDKELALHVYLAVRGRLRRSAPGTGARRGRRTGPGPSRRRAAP